MKHEPLIGKVGKTGQMRLFDREYSLGSVEVDSLHFQSVDHPRFRLLRIILQVYGLWRPYNNKAWLIYQAFYFLITLSFLIFWIMATASADVSKDINALFKLLQLPSRFSNNAQLFIPSLFINSMPVISYISIFLYLNHHLTCTLSIPRKTRIGTYASGDDEEKLDYDTVIHFGKLLNKIHILDIKTENKIGFEDIFVHKMKIAAIGVVFWHALTCILITIVSCSQTNQCGGINILTDTVYLLWLLVWIGSPFCLCFLIKLVSNIHCFQLEYIIYVITNAKYGSFQHLKKVIYNIDQSIQLSTEKFSLIIICNAVVPIIVFSTIMLFDTFTSNEKFQLWTDGHYAWLWITMISYGLIAIYQIYCCANVSSLCDQLVVATHLIETNDEITVNNIFYLTSFIKDLKMGWFVASIRVDKQVLSRVLTVLTSLIIFIIQKSFYE